VLGVAFKQWPTSKDIQDLQAWADDTLKVASEEARVDKLVDALDWFYSESELSKLDDHERLKQAVEACSGVILSEAQTTTVEKITGFVEGVVRIQLDWLREKNLRPCLGLLDPIVSILPKNPRQQVLYDKVSFANSVVELYNTDRAFEKLGNDTTERTVADSDFGRIKALMQKYADVHFKMEADEGLKVLCKGEFKQAMETAEKTIEAAGHVAMERISTTLSVMIRASSLWCGGQADEGSWSDGISGKATLQQVLDVAGTSLLKAHCSKYQQAALDLNATIEAVQSTAAIFELHPCQASLQRASEVHDRAWLSYYEGLLVTLFNDAKDPKELKKSVKGVKAMMTGEPANLKWEMLQEILGARANNALRLR